jgi:hypothetical protein
MRKGELMDVDIDCQGRAVVVAPAPSTPLSQSFAAHSKLKCVEKNIGSLVNLVTRSPRRPGQLIFV